MALMDDRTRADEAAQEIGTLDSPTMNGTTPQPDAGVLLTQAKERLRVAIEAFADAEAELDRARKHLVMNPGRPSQEAVAFARELLLQAEDEEDSADEAVRVYSARFEREANAASYARTSALMEAAAAERAEKDAAFNAKEIASREHLAAVRRAFANRGADVPISAEDAAARYNESEDERQERLQNVRLRGWALLRRVQDQARDRRDQEDAGR